MATPSDFNYFSVALPSLDVALPSLDEERREVVMATPSDFNLPVPHASPYCSDPDCRSCKELREVQEAIRLHEPVPVRKSA